MNLAVTPFLSLTSRASLGEFASARASVPEGHVASRRLDILTDEYTSDNAHWSTQVATVRRVESTLRGALVAADDEDVWMRDYLHE